MKEISTLDEITSPLENNASSHTDHKETSMIDVSDTVMTEPQVQINKNARHFQMPTQIPIVIPILTLEIPGLWTY